MRTYYVMSDSSDDLMWTDHSLRNARNEIRRMRNMTPERGDHRYFPLSIQVDAPRSPFRRRMRILETHTLTTETKHLTPTYVRENGERE
jgi:hypothetical protein